MFFFQALRLSHLALGETTVGQLVNILSNDVNRFDVVCERYAHAHNRSTDTLKLSKCECTIETQFVRAACRRIFIFTRSWSFSHSIQALIFLQYLWIAPIQLTLVAALLWREIGVSCLAGLSIIVLMAPLQVFMGKLFSKLRCGFQGVLKTWPLAM